MDIGNDDPDAYEYAEEPSIGRPRDPRTDDAKAAIVQLFQEHPRRVFYGRQIEVLLEHRFFHWITSRGLNEIAREGRIQALTAPLSVGLGSEPPTAGGPLIRFFWSPRNRYWRRQAEAVRRLVAEFSRPEFGRALGNHGEQMFDAALPRAGFMPRGRDVRQYADRAWTETGHDLDRVFERDGVAYGVEVKNTLDYIERQELEVKIRMCSALGLRPLFIVRMAPKSYIEQVRREGGFTLVFKYQLYPHGHLGLARQVQDELGLPVDAPAAIAEGTVQRLLRWHREVNEPGGAA